MLKQEAIKRANLINFIKKVDYIVQEKLPIDRQVNYEKQEVIVDVREDKNMDFEQKQKDIIDLKEMTKVVVRDLKRIVWDMIKDQIKEANNSISSIEN